MYRLVLVLLYFIHCVSGSETHRCPSHLTRNHYLKTFRDQCYLFVPNEKYWSHARDDCHNRGHGHHVVIPDEETQHFVMQSLADLKWPWNGVWIGAFDFEGPWKWVTGETVKWSNWAKGQPGNKCVIPIIKKGCEDCGNLRTTDGKWHDYMCDSFPYKYSYICQYPMGPELSNASSAAHVNGTVPEQNIPLSSTLSPATSQNRTGPEDDSSAAIVDKTKPGKQTDPDNSNQAPFGASQKVQSINGSEGLSTGAIIGIIMAIVFACIVLLIILFLLMARKRSKRDDNEPSVIFDNITYVIRTLKPGSKPKKERLNSNNNCAHACAEGAENHYDDLPERRPRDDVPHRKPPRVFVRNQIDNNLGKNIDSFAESDITDIKSGLYDDLSEYEEPKSLGACNLGFDSMEDDCDYLSSIKSNQIDDDEFVKCGGYDDVDYSTENSANEKASNTRLSFEDNDFKKADTVHKNNLYVTPK